MIEKGERKLMSAAETCEREPFSRTLETERLVLRPLSVQDKDTIYQLVTASGDLHIHTHIPEHYTRDDARQWVEANAGRPYFFVVCDRVTQEAMGVLSVVEFDTLLRRAEVGFWIGKAYRGHAFMAEALKTMVRDLFENTQTEKIIGRALECNDASAKTLLSAGFRQEARLPKHEYHCGEMKDILIFGILRS